MSSNTLIITRFESGVVTLDWGGLFNISTPHISRHTQCTPRILLMNIQSPILRANCGCCMGFFILFYPCNLSIKSSCSTGILHPSHSFLPQLSLSKKVEPLMSTRTMAKPRKVYRHCEEDWHFQVLCSLMYTTRILILIPDMLQTSLNLAGMYHFLLRQYPFGPVDLRV